MRRGRVFILVVEVSLQVKEIFVAVFAFFWFSCVNKQYFLGLLGRACGAEGTSVGADANECSKGMMHCQVKTSAVARARIHDIHVHMHMQKTPEPSCPLPSESAP